MAISPVLKSQGLKTNMQLTIKTPDGWNDLQPGESVATNGICLTVADVRKNEYDVVLIPETLHKTTVGHTVPSMVNLERALSATERFGGHFVQGHIDAVGTVTDIGMSRGYELEIAYPQEFQKLVIPKGSITIDGVALTVARLKKSTLTVSLIPYTLQHTTLQSLRPGDKVNLEFDMLGKYVINFMEHK